MGAGVGSQTTGVELGERFKAAWELAAVMGQVQVYGWQKLIVRCRAQRPWTHTTPITRAHAFVNAFNKARFLKLNGCLASAQIVRINRVRDSLRNRQKQSQRHTEYYSYDGERTGR